MSSKRTRVESCRPTCLYILNFHGIGTPRHELSANEKELWIDTAKFQAILDCVGGRNDIRLTFDDSNESDYTIALPELKSRNLHAQFFVVAGRLGQPGYLSPPQIEALIAASMTVGSHGMRHRRWAGLSELELQEELVEARDRLEQIAGRPITSAACPFGSYNRRVIKRLVAAGYRSIYTSDDGPARDQALILPRTSITRSQDVAALKRIGSDPPGWFRHYWQQAKLWLKQRR
jgi:peptidoglycan/xylan/chitin deacetylase (PgdA/CDA1 family)